MFKATLNGIFSSVRHDDVTVDDSVTLSFLKVVLHQKVDLRGKKNAHFKNVVKKVKVR